MVFFSPQYEEDLFIIHFSMDFESVSTSTYLKIFVNRHKNKQKLDGWCPELVNCIDFVFQRTPFSSIALYVRYHSSKQTSTFLIHQITSASQNYIAHCNHLLPVDNIVCVIRKSCIVCFHENIHWIKLVLMQSPCVKCVISLQ